MTQIKRTVTVGVLALQGAFSEHIQLLEQAARIQSQNISDSEWRIIEVRTPEQLGQCDALIIPGGESTTMSLVAQRSELLEPLRAFVKSERKPTWGTCAGLILLAESANHTKKGGQELIGGLDVKVNRNHFGRQVESFQVDLTFPFLPSLQDLNSETSANRPFRTIFIRAPVVEKILRRVEGVQVDEEAKDDTIVAPSKPLGDAVEKEQVEKEVEVLARLPNAAKYRSSNAAAIMEHEDDIIAVRQGNCFGTSFHPELTGDSRIHEWWLGEVLEQLDRRKAA